jgi:hypothetical protein
MVCSLSCADGWGNGGGSGEGILGGIGGLFFPSIIMCKEDALSNVYNGDFNYVLMVSPIYTTIPPIYTSIGPSPIQQLH